MLYHFSYGALLSALQNVHVMCRHRSGINHSPSGSEEHFLQFHKSQFNKLLVSDCRVSCGAGMGKAFVASPAPIPVSLKENTAKALGHRLGPGQVPKTCYSCVLLILQSRPGPLQGLWAPTSITAVGWGTGVL